MPGLAPGDDVPSPGNQQVDVAAPPRDQPFDVGCIEAGGADLRQKGFLQLKQLARLGETTIQFGYDMHSGTRERTGCQRSVKK